MTTDNFHYQRVLLGPMAHACCHLTIVFGRFQQTRNPMSKAPATQDNTSLSPTSRSKLSEWGSFDSDSIIDSKSDIIPKPVRSENQGQTIYIQKTETNRTQIPTGPFTFTSLANTSSTPPRSVAHTSLYSPTSSLICYAYDLTNAQTHTTQAVNYSYHNEHYKMKCLQKKEEYTHAIIPHTPSHLMVSHITLRFLTHLKRWFTIPLSPLLK